MSLNVVRTTFEMGGCCTWVILSGMVETLWKTVSHDHVPLTTSLVCLSCFLWWTGTSDMPPSPKPRRLLIKAVWMLSRDVSCLM